MRNEMFDNAHHITDGSCSKMYLKYINMTDDDPDDIDGLCSWEAVYKVYGVPTEGYI